MDEQEEISSMEDSSRDNNKEPVPTSCERNNLPVVRSESQSSQVNQINFVEIGAKLHKHLAEGNIDEILAIDINLDKLKSKQQNSVLHIAATAGQAQLIAQLLPRTKSIIEWKNNKDDLAFHTAAKASEFESLKALMNWQIYDPEANIDRALLGLQNVEGDTPLHIALQINKKQMGWLLVDEYFQACYRSNKRDESPLYMAIKLQSWDLVKHMISYTCQDKMASELNLLQGKSVVHAAIDSQNTEILRHILDNHEELMKSVDDKGQSPLSYAAFKGNLAAVQYLLEKFPDYAYECDNEGCFPIHMAASGGNLEVIKLLHLTKKVFNSKGESILHVAAESGKSKVVSYLLKIPELEGLINLKDEDGNTPLHLATKAFHPRAVYIFTSEKRCKLNLHNKDGFTAFDLAEIHASLYVPWTLEVRLTWRALMNVNAPRGSSETRISYIQNIRAAKIQENRKDVYLEGINRQRNDTYLLVGALVVTVTFAAGFTLPGGYIQSDTDQNIGMAVLARKWAFEVFVLCNTAALYSAMISVVTLVWLNLIGPKLTFVSLNLALILLGCSLTFMSVAYTMGVFVVLRTVSWISYVVLAMGSNFLLFSVFLYFSPLCFPQYTKNPMFRVFNSVSFLLMLLVFENF